MGYKVSAKAAEDLEGIWLYTKKQWSLEQADRYLALIFDEIRNLTHDQGAGRDRGHIRVGYRCSTVKAHVVYYRVNEADGQLEVIRVLHQRMDSEGQLGA